MAGRKSKLTPEVIRELAEAIEAGMPYEAACEYAEISYRSFHDWINGRFPASVSEEHRSLFLQSIKGAAAEAAYQALGVIQAAGSGELPPGADWKSAAWFLERRYPEHFGRGSRRRDSGDPLELP
jgi:hypothetical protein